MKILEESEQFQVGFVVTRNPIYGWTKIIKGGWSAWGEMSYIPVAKFPSSVTALKYHPKYTSFMGQAIIWDSPAKGIIGVISASKTSLCFCLSWKSMIFCSRTPGWKTCCFLPGMNPFRNGWNTCVCPCSGWSLVLSGSNLCQFCSLTAMGWSPVLVECFCEPLWKAPQ